VKLDKRHLIGSVILMVCAIAYNVWVFTNPTSASANASRAIEPPPGAMMPLQAGADPSGAAVDPTQVPAPPDVALDRRPEWPRDPFTSLRTAPAAIVLEDTAAAPAPPPDADPVVASILYSDARRLAVVSGRIVREGEQVGPDRIVSILPGGVVVESGSKGRRTLMLRTPSIGVARP
jgi:hypothetical protein